jgi:hypothetical protein
MWNLFKAVCDVKNKSSETACMTAAGFLVEILRRLESRNQAARAWSSSDDPSHFSLPASIVIFGREQHAVEDLATGVVGRTSGNVRQAPEGGGRKLGRRAHGECIGLTSDLKARLDKHNEGGSPHTAKFKPWSLVTYHAFASRAQTAAFESYLKTGSGRAFAAKRLW